jgi:hypothetical protein
MIFLAKNISKIITSVPEQENSKIDPKYERNGVELLRYRTSIISLLERLKINFKFFFFYCQSLTLSALLLAKDVPVHIYVHIYSNMKQSELAFVSGLNCVYHSRVFKGGLPRKKLLS